MEVVVVEEEEATVVVEEATVVGMGWRRTCSGRWRGTTEVMMMTHFNNSSWVVRSPFSSPALKT